MVNTIFPQFCPYYKKKDWRILYCFPYSSSLPKTLCQKEMNEFHFQTGVPGEMITQTGDLRKRLFCFL